MTWGVQRRFQGPGQLLRRGRRFLARVNRLHERRRLLHLGLRPDVRDRVLRLRAAFGGRGPVILDDVADVELQPPAIRALPGHAP